MGFNQKKTNLKLQAQCTTTAFKQLYQSTILSGLDNYTQKEKMPVMVVSFVWSNLMLSSKSAKEKFKFYFLL